MLPWTLHFINSKVQSVCHQGSRKLRAERSRVCTVNSHSYIHYFKNSLLKSNWVSNIGRLTGRYFKTHGLQVKSPVLNKALKYRFVAIRLWYNNYSTAKTSLFHRSSSAISRQLAQHLSSLLSSWSCKMSSEKEARGCSCCKGSWALHADWV